MVFSSKTYSPLTIAGAFIGAMVGAGFASGQEIMQFFVFAGPAGLLGIIGACILFFYIGNLIMKMAFHARTPVYRDLIVKTFGRSGLFWAFDILISFSFFGVLVVMTSGAGALFNEFLGLPFWVGGALVLMPTFVTVLLGRGAVIRAISVIVPLVLIGIALITIFTLWQHPLSLREFIHSAEPQKAVAQGLVPVSAVLYAAYNILLTLAVLTTLGSAVSSTRILRMGALLGALGLGAASLCIFTALAADLPTTAASEIPMLNLASRIHPLLAGGYGVVLLLEIYTSTLSLLYGLTDRFFKLPESHEARGNIGPAVFLVCVAALFCSYIGFSNMVSLFYPALGVGSIVFCGLLWRRRHIILGSDKVSKF
ncbi:MAG: hypothetical protein FWF88_07575 [Peptococcaceae bacterium]|nr:hypothetical protein [Peptococcaceae bacterium]